VHRQPRADRREAHRSIRERPLWAETYERDMGDVMALQSEVARTIAERIEVELTRRSTHTSLKPDDASIPRSTSVSAGRYFWHKRTSESVRRGLSCFEQAVHLNRTTRPRTRGSRLVHRRRRALLDVPPKVAYDRAGAAALRRAARRQPRRGAHLARGRAHGFNWDWRGPTGSTVAPSN